MGNRSGDFCVVGAEAGVVAGGMDTVTTVVAGASVFSVVGPLSIMLNVVDPVTSIVIPETFTRY